MHQRSTLRAGKDAAIDPFEMLLLAQNQAAARATQRLVRGRGHKVGVGNRAVVHAGSDQSGVMGHVDHQQGADLVGDFGKFVVRNLARIGTRTGHDQLRFVLASQRGDLVKVQPMRVAINAVADESCTGSR